MNIVLIGQSKEINEHSKELHDKYSLIKIDGDSILKENNIVASKGKRSYGLFEVVFNNLINKYMDKIAVSYIKTGFVFINYPVNEQQYLSLKNKLQSVGSNIDLIIELVEQGNDNDVSNFKSQNKNKWVTINKDYKDFEEISKEIKKNIIRFGMKKIINSKGYIGKPIKY